MRTIYENPNNSSIPTAIGGDTNRGDHGGRLATGFAPSIIGLPAPRFIIFPLPQPSTFSRNSNPATTAVANDSTMSNNNMVVNIANGAAEERPYEETPGEKFFYIFLRYLEKRERKRRQRQSSTDRGNNGSSSKRPTEPQPHSSSHADPHPYRQAHSYPKLVEPELESDESVAASDSSSSSSWSIDIPFVDHEEVHQCKHCAKWLSVFETHCTCRPRPENYYYVQNWMKKFGEEQLPKPIAGEILCGFADKLEKRGPVTSLSALW